MNSGTQCWLRNGDIRQDILRSTTNIKHSSFHLKDSQDIIVKEETGKEKKKTEQDLDGRIKDLTSQMKQLERDVEENRRNHDKVCDHPQGTLETVNRNLKPRLFFINLSVHELLAETEERPPKDDRRVQTDSLREEVIRLYLLLDMFRAKMENKERVEKTDEAMRNGHILDVGRRKVESIENIRKENILEDTSKEEILETTKEGIFCLPDTIISSYEEHVKILEQFQTHPPSLCCSEMVVVSPRRRFLRISLMIASLLGLVMILAFLLARPHCCDAGPFTLPYRIYPVIYGYGPKPF